MTGDLRRGIQTGRWAQLYRMFPSEMEGPYVMTGFLSNATAEPKPTLFLGET